jgi:hypothetical protein
LEGSRIERVRVAGQGPLVLSVGGAALFGSGAECRNPGSARGAELAILGIYTRDGRRYNWEKELYRWEGIDLFQVDRRNGVIVSRGDNDPRLQRFWQFRCGSVLVG